MVLLRSPHAHARVGQWTSRGARRAGRARGLDRGGPARRRGQAHPVSAAVQARRRPADVRAAAHAARRGARVLRRPPCGRGGGADARAGAGRRGSRAVEYEELPCVVDARRAVAPGEPQLWPEAPGNVVAETRFGKPTEAQAAFARAAHVTEIELHNQRVIAEAMEPRCAIGVHEAAALRSTRNASSRPPRATCWRRRLAASPRTSASSTATSAAASA